MFWIPIMMAASAIMQKEQQNGQIKNANLTAKANTQIANIQQTSNSTLSAAKGALNRFNQSLQTRDALKGYGDNYNQLEDAKVKLGEQMTTGTFQNRLAAAEAAGALQARASAAGVGGGTISMLDSTAALQQNVGQAAADQAYSDQLYQLNDAEQTNLYDQLGITQKQNVFLDDVAGADIVGPAKIPTSSFGSMALTGALAFMSAASSTGGFDKGGSMDLSGAGAKLKSWFSSSGGQSSGTGANSFFQIGGRT